MKERGKGRIPISEGALGVQMPTEEALLVLARALLDGLDAIVDHHLADLHDGAVLEYERLEPAVPNIRELGRLLIERVVRDDAGWPSLEREWRRNAERRANEGVALDALLRALQSAQALLWDAVGSTSARLGLPPDVATAANRRILSIVGPAMASAVEAYRVVDADRRRSEERSQGALLRELLAGAIRAIDMPRRLAGHGLKADQPCVLTVMRVHASLSAERVERAARERAELAGGVVAWLDGDLVCLLDAAPPLDDSGVTAAIGLPVLPSDLAPVAVITRSVLEAASAFGFFGPVDVASVGPLLAVHGDDLVGSAVVDRCIAPVAALGAFGDTLIETVRAHLDAGIRPEKTARALFIHRNTLAKRLRRYEDLTGLNFNDVDDIVAVWWALRRIQATRGAEAAPPARRGPQDLPT